MDVNEEGTIKRSRTISDRDLSYWMGSVDTNLTTVRTMLQGLIKSNEANQVESRQWQSRIEGTLADHNKHFAISDRRIIALENEVIAFHAKKNKSNGNENDDEFVAWSWIRDKIIVPIVVWGIILLLGYIAVNAIPLP